METEIFREEALELLDDIEDTLLLLRDDMQNRDHINRIFRGIHTIKGSGAMFGFDEVSGFAHKFENTIDAIRKGEVILNGDYLDIFLTARDHIKVILTAENPSAREITRISQQIIQQLIAVAGPMTPATQPQLPPTKIVSPPSNNMTAPHRAAAVPAPGQPPRKVNQAQDTTMLNLPHLKTLVVEDEFISRYILQEFLFPLGTCHIAVNGFEAILAFKTALVENSHYDLVCLDIMMPGMTGIEVAKEMRRLESEMAVSTPCRIFMTTALSDKETIVDMFQEKLCNAYLIKPLVKEKLYELLKNFFGRPGK